MQNEYTVIDTRKCALGQVEPMLEPDALHPNAAGMELLARCLSPFVEDAFRRL